MRGRRSRGLVVVSLVAATLVGIAISLTKARSGTIDIWYDDAWVAITTRLPAGSAFTINGAPGFTAIARWWIGVGGGSVAWSQSLAFLGYLAIVPAVYWAAVRTCATRWASVVVACSALLAPVLVTESAHIKQYTWECTLSALMVGITAAAARREPTLRRVVVGVALVCVGIVFSGALLMPGAVMVGVLLIAEARALRAGRRAGVAARVALLAVAVLFAAGWVGLVLGQVSSGYNDSWRGYGAFLGSSGSIRSTATQLLTLVRGFMGGFFAGASQVFASSIVAAAAVVGLVAYSVLRWRAVWWVLAAPVVAVVASATEKYPLGPVGFGRVDSWLFPWVAALLAQLLVDVWTFAARRAPRLEHRRTWTIVGVACFCVLALASWRVVKRYPSTRAQAAADSLHLRAPGTSAYVEQSDMPVLLLARGPVVSVTTTARAALNGTIVRPSGAIGLLDLRPSGRSRAVAELRRRCGTTVLVVGASASSLAPVLHDLPCRVQSTRRDTRGTATHWDDGIVIELGERSPE